MNTIIFHQSNQFFPDPFFSIFSHFLLFPLTFPHLLPKNLLKRTKTPLISIFRSFFLLHSPTYTHIHARKPPTPSLNQNPSIFHFKAHLSDFLPLSLHFIHPIPKSVLKRRFSPSFLFPCLFPLPKFPFQTFVTYTHSTTYNQIIQNSAESDLAGASSPTFSNCLTINLLTIFF